jgi:hypothetical protein
MSPELFSKIADDLQQHNIYWVQRRVSFLVPIVSNFDKADVDRLILCRIVARN